MIKDKNERRREKWCFAILELEIVAAEQLACCGECDNWLLRDRGKQRDVSDMQRNTTMGEIASYDGALLSIGSRVVRESTAVTPDGGICRDSPPSELPCPAKLFAGALSRLCTLI